MAHSKILTPLENECLTYLEKAQELFNRIVSEDPQDSGDGYNFGHYVDAARNAVIIRGARRADPDNLIRQPKHVDTVIDKILDLPEFHVDKGGNT